MNSKVLIDEFEDYLTDLGRPLLKAFRKFAPKEKARGVIEYDRESGRWRIRVEESDEDVATEKPAQDTATPDSGTMAGKPVTEMMSNWAENGVLLIDGVAGKVCCSCGEWKPLTEYYNWSRSKDGKGTRCKSCTRIYQAERYKNECLKRFEKNENGSNN